MATRDGKSPIGDYSGKIGNIVMSPWNDKMIVRLVPRGRKEATSAKLIKQNDLFKLVMNFLKLASAVINVGFQQPRKPSMTKFNAAISYHILNAVILDLAGAFMDMEKVKFSKPIWVTQAAWKANAVAEPGLKIKVSWALNPFPNKCTQLDDKAHLVFYHNQTQKFTIFTAIAERKSLGYTCNFPIIQQDTDCFCYLFMTSADGKLVAYTQYLGMFTLIA
jgi:hypothetical protein